MRIESRRDGGCDEADDAFERAIAVRVDEVDLEFRKELGAQLEATAVARPSLWRSESTRLNGLQRTQAKRALPSRGGSRGWSSCSGRAGSVGRGARRKQVCLLGEVTDAASPRPPAWRWGALARPMMGALVDTANWPCRRKRPDPDTLGCFLARWDDDAVAFERQHTVMRRM